MFREEIKKCNNIYDVMATCYSHLLPFHAFKGNINDDKYKDVHSAIQVYVELSKYNEADGLVELATLLNDIIENDISVLNDDLFYFQIIESIDILVIYNYPRTSQKFKLYSDISTLNTNSLNNNIYILPRMSNTIVNEMERYSKKKDPKKKGLRERSRKTEHESINFKLKNYVIYHNVEYKPNLTILTDNDIFFKNIVKRKTLNIGIVPLMQESVFSLFDIDKTKRATFSIIKPKDDSKNIIIKAFKKQLEFFIGKDVDIIIFPEMYLIEDIIGNIKEIITESLCTGYNSNLKIIVAGTFWKDKNNKCFVMDSFGNTIYIQNKFQPYWYEGKLEDLNADNYMVNILDINGLGRLLTLICIDITNSDLFKLFTEIYGDIACFPAYSPSLELKNDALKYTTKTNCISIFSNACAPRYSENSIGFCSIPERSITRSSATIIEYGCNSKLDTSKRSCDKCFQCSTCLCKPKILSIEYNNFLYDDSTLKCKVSIV